MAATTSFIKDRPDGYAAPTAMGACYSSGRSKPSPSSSAPSSSQSKSASQSKLASQSRNSASPNSGKARRSQSMCSDSSKNTRRKGDGKGGSASFGPHARHGGSVLMHASNVTHGAEPLEGSATASQGLNGYAQDKGPSFAAGEDCSQVSPNRAVSSTMSVMEGQVPSSCKEFDSIGNANARCISDVSVLLAATEHSTSAISTASSSISSPRQMHRSPSGKVFKPSTPTMHSTRIEMKSPSLKSGVGAYEVLTPRKLVAGVHGMSPSKSDSSLKRTSTETGSKIDLVGVNNSAVPKVAEGPSKAISLPLVSKGSGVKELCKNCKIGNWDSVCYIANDGRIAAANTRPATVCQFHHCTSPKCAANSNYQPPSALPSKKVLLGKSSLSRLHSDKANVKANKSHASDDSESCSSTKSSIREGRTGNKQLKDQGSAHRIFANNGSDCEAKVSDAAEVCDTSARSHECRSESVQKGAKALQQSCQCAEDDETHASPLHEEAVPGMMHPLQSDGGDDFGACSDIADAPLTGAKDGACRVLEIKEDLAESEAAKVSQTRKYNMERMRQRYLDCLKEQEAETVRLRKQELIARKQAGEWMFDSAIGEILQKLAPDGEAGVKVIVEAFETVMQNGDLELHHSDAASIDG
ncbi:hypothetical protein L7F22_061628 [Adiantum nelumboides]|nr:hypothetical protein [Adiantum nelumboides]